MLPPKAPPKKLEQQEDGPKDFSPVAENATDALEEEKGPADSTDQAKEGAAGAATTKRSASKAKSSKS